MSTERTSTRGVVGWLMLGALSLILAGCPASTESGGGHDGESMPAGESAGEGSAAAEVITNRVDVPPTVRRNLGITFVDAERRIVSDSIRVPGFFERRPEAYRDYFARLNGRVDLQVGYLQEVAAGDVLFTVDSPSWTEARLAIRSAEVTQREAASSVRVAQAALNQAEATVELPAEGLASLEDLEAAHQQHKEALQAVLEIWQARETELLDLIEGGAGLSSQLVEARASIAQIRSQLRSFIEEDAEIERQRTAIRQAIAERRAEIPHLQAELDHAQQAVERANERRDLAVQHAAARIGMTPAELTEEVDLADGGRGPRWQSLERLTVRAESACTIQELVVTDGAWVQEGDAVLMTCRPDMLMFRATAMQADLPRLRGDALAGQIVPPTGGQLASVPAIPVEITYGLDSDPHNRELALIATMPDRAPFPWGRHGLAASLEVRADGTGGYVIAVPRRSVVTDGLQAVLFRRDPADEDKVIRMNVELGANDGRWVEIKAGLAMGDQIVMDGAYELMLASSSVQQEGGHFHADGTFHTGSHDDE